MSTQTPIAETSVAVGGTKVERRGLTDIVYHVFDKPGKYTLTVKSKIPAIEYLVVGASGGTINGYTPGGGGAVVTGATTSSLEPGEYAVEVGSIGGKVETKVTMVNCNQNSTTCKQTPYTQSMTFPNGSYTGVPSGTYLSCGGIQSTPTKMTEEIYAPGGASSFLTHKANGGGPGAQKPTMISVWDRNRGRYNTSVPANQYQYAFPETYWKALQGKAPGNPAFTAFSCGQFDLDYIAGASGSGHGGTRFQNCCGWQGQPSDPNCCVNASGGAGGPAKRPGTKQAEPGAGVVSGITGTAVEYGHGAGGNVNAKSAKNGVVIIAYNLAAAEAEATPPPTTAAPTTPAPAKVAEGGTVDRVGFSSVLTHTFKESGEFVVHRPVLLRYLVVGGVGGRDGGGGEVKKGGFEEYLQPGRYKVTVGKAGATVENQRTDTSCTDWTETCRINPVTNNRLCGGPDKPRTFILRDYIGKVGESSIFLDVVASGGRPSSLQGYVSKVDKNVGPDVYHNPSGWPESWLSANYNPHESYANKYLGTCIQSSSVSSGNDSGPVEDDITGESVTYGTKQTSGIVILSYDENKAGSIFHPSPTSPPVDIGAIIREYDTKMAQLKEAMAAEKQALLDQNASAAEQARAVKEQLTADLYALKKSYDELVARLATTTSEYDTKLAQLEAAKKAELDAAKAQNEAAVAAAQAAQAKLQGELEGLKAMLGSGQGIGRTLYVIVHAPSWLEQGELNALTLSDSGTISVAPYKYRDYTQTFALAPNGSIIRCLSRSGLYLADEGCSTPISSESFAAPWSLFSTGRHTLERLIASRKCGKYLASLMHNEVSFESIPTPWYLVPVGSMS